MKIEEIRPSFTAYLIATEMDEFAGLAEALRLAGYMVASFNQLTAAQSELVSNPPHFVMLSYTEKKFNLKNAIEQISGQLPESHLLLITPASERQKASAYLDKGIYDLILTPLVSESELVRTLDRATERDYFMYLNERLLQNQAEVSPIHDHPENRDLDTAHRLFSCTTPDECMQLFLETMSPLLGSCPAVFFKYVQNRRLLMVGESVGAEHFSLDGLGLNFNEISPGFRTVQLRQPMKIEEFSSMVREVFETREFVAWPVEAMGEIQGVVCFLCAPPGGMLESKLQNWLDVLSKALSLLEAEKRLHVVSTKDLTTDVLNRQNFMIKVGEEISRSRRTKLPVALVQIAIDQFGRLNSMFGLEESMTVMRTAAQIFQKHSRVNDIVGRMGTDEFGLLLPHTEKEGAMIKAERLRRMFETADFEKIMRGVGKITISLGVSEYPTLARDTEELVQTADDALYQVRDGGNKTCVAKASEDFEPDFVVPAKGL